MDRIEKRKRLTKHTELFKSVLLGLLVFSMIALVAVYIGGTRVYESAVAGDEAGKSFDKLWSVLGGIEPDGLDSERLFPEFIGYKLSSNPRPLGCVGDGEAAEELYGIIKPCLLELFGSSSVCRSLRGTEGKRLFDAAAKNDEFVYLRFHAPVLYQLIYAYAADRLTVSQMDVAAGTDGNVGAYIDELIIIPDKNFAAHRFIAYACDGEGGYYEFRPGDHVVSSEFYISKLADRAEKTVSEFEFSSEGVFASLQPLIDKELECDVICKEPVNGDGDGIREGLLRLMGYNPDKLTGFADEAEGAYVYIDSQSRLKLGVGTVSFLTTDAYSPVGDKWRGIGVDTLLGYSIDGTPTLFDKLTAVDNLIGRLYDISPALVGGEGQLCLGDVYVDGAQLVVEYILTYDNIRVGSDAYLRAVLTEDAVCELLLYPVNVTVSAETSLSPRPAYVFGKLGLLQPENESLTLGRAYLKYENGQARWEANVES